MATHSNATETTGQTQRKRSTADHQIRDHGGGEPEQGQIVPVSGLPAHQVRHADRGRDTRHDAHQRGREQAGQRREEQAVAQQVVTRVPLVVPQDEPEPSEQPDPVLLGRRVRAAQADCEHQQTQREREPPRMADERAERAAKGMLEAVDTTQGESRRPVALTLVRQDGLVARRARAARPAQRGRPAPRRPQLPHLHFPIGKRREGPNPPAAWRVDSTVDAIEAAVVAAAGTARAFPAPAAG